jgi:phenylacetate-CoA ligase
MLEAAPENLGRPELTRLQEDRLRLLAESLPRNRFYAEKLAAAGVAVSALRGLADLPRLPFTTKAELLREQEQHPPYGRVLTEDLQCYRRLHQTSGTSGQPLRWLDTEASWTALLDTWSAFFRIIGLRPDDRAFFPFSFGPFLGFWTAFEAAARHGCLCLPGGGMSTTARLRFLLDNRATVVFCTPTYALRLAEVARQQGIALDQAGVRALIVAGEPGGSIPATRDRIEEAWRARVFDHSGMTEIGPLSIECPAQPGGLHPLESDFVIEVIDPETGKPVGPGAPGELVVTTLHRIASPLLRYRTGDLVCLAPEPCACGRALVRLEGGIRGRVDDMIVLRGNNLHPSALQMILHRFVEVAEYRVEVDRSGSLPILRIEVEPNQAESGAALAESVAEAVYDELLFRAEVRAVPPGTLPRFELKAQRVVRKNGAGSATGTPTC